MPKTAFQTPSERSITCIDHPLPLGSAFPSTSTGIWTRLVGRGEKGQLGLSPTTSFGQGEPPINRARLELTVDRRMGCNHWRERDDPVPRRGRMPLPP